MWGTEKFFLETVLSNKQFLSHKVSAQNGWVEYFYQNQSILYNIIQGSSRSITSLNNIYRWAEWQTAKATCKGVGPCGYGHQLLWCIQCGVGSSNIWPIILNPPVQSLQSLQSHEHQRCPDCLEARGCQPCAAGAGLEEMVSSYRRTSPLLRCATCTTTPPPSGTTLPSTSGSSQYTGRVKSDIKWRNVLKLFDSTKSII